MAIIVAAVGIHFYFQLSGPTECSLLASSSHHLGLNPGFNPSTPRSYNFFTIPRDVTVLRQQNEALKNQVSLLESQVLELQQQLSETKILYALLDYARTEPENKYVAASVIGRDPSPFLSYIIIDHGSDDGILYGMPVVTQQGLVGRVVA